MKGMFIILSTSREKNFGDFHLNEIQQREENRRQMVTFLLHADGSTIEVCGARIDFGEQFVGSAL